MANGLDIDATAFLAGFQGALLDMRDHDGADFLHEMGMRGAGIARSRAPRGATGAIVAGIGVEAGRDADGPYVDFGVLNPPSRREDFYQEFGTYKDPAQPFMRPAVAELGGSSTAIGGRGSARRANKRSIIHQYRRSGLITAAEARAASRQVSSKFRTRRRR